MPNEVDHSLSEKKLHLLEKKYPWLRIFSGDIKNYIPSILKPYIF